MWTDACTDKQTDIETDFITLTWSHTSHMQYKNTCLQQH